MSIRIHKLEIARRQFEVAAEIFFAGGDHLAVVTLAGAAEEILGSLVRRTGKGAIFDHLVELDKGLTGGRDLATVNREINGVRNALKHASDPKEDEIEFEADDAIAMLGRAVANFSSLDVEPTPNMIKVYRYLKTLHPGGNHGSTSC